MRSRLCLFALSLLLVAATPFEPPHSGIRTVYRHAALIDGTGAPLKGDMAVITDGERIVDVVPDRALTARSRSISPVVSCCPATSTPISISPPRPTGPTRKRG